MNKQEKLRELDYLLDDIVNKYDELWYSLRKELTETMTGLLDNNPNNTLMFDEKYYGEYENIRGFKIDKDYPEDVEIITKDGMQNSLDLFDINEMRDFGMMLIDGEYEIVEQ